MEIYLLLYLLLIVAPIGTVIHECGHLIGAKIVQADKVILSIGLGKKLKSISFRKTKLVFHTILFLGGSLNSRRKQRYTSLEMVCITIFGPINNGLFACLFYYLYMIQPNFYVKLLFLFNLWLAIINIIPFKIGEKRSDGYIILQTILHK